MRVVRETCELGPDRVTPERGSAASILTIAVGIGINTALFSLVNGLALRDLERSSFYVPASAQPLLRPDRNFYDDEHLSWLTLVGRRKPGVSIEQVRAELAVVAARIDSAQPGRTTRLLVERATRFRMVVERRIVLGVAAVVMAAFGLVLLVACANVANMLLARGASRGREIAMRAALGASRRRLVQHVLAESVLISMVGGAAGGLIAFWLFEAVPPVLLSSLPSDVPPFWIDVSPDWRGLSIPDSSCACIAWRRTCSSGRASRAS
jgi:hypothetical protein